MTKSTDSNAIKGGQITPGHSITESKSGEGRQLVQSAGQEDELS